MEKWYTLKKIFYALWVTKYNLCHISTFFRQFKKKSAQALGDTNRFVFPKNKQPYRKATKVIKWPLESKQNLFKKSCEYSLQIFSESLNSANSFTRSFQHLPHTCDIVTLNFGLPSTLGECMNFTMLIFCTTLQKKTSFTFYTLFLLVEY